MRFILTLLVLLWAHAGAGEMRWAMLTTPYGGYVANLDEAVVGALLAGTYEAPFIRLEDPYWYDATMSPVFVRDSESRGVRYGFDGTVWLRTANIRRINEMERAHVEALLEERALRQRILSQEGGTE